MLSLIECTEHTVAMGEKRVRLFGAASVDTEENFYSCNKLDSLRTRSSLMLSRLNQVASW